MKTVVLLIALMMLMFSCSSEQPGMGKVDKAELSSAEEAPKDWDQLLANPNPVGEYGANLEVSEDIDLATILKNPTEYMGKRVRVSGNVVDTCPMRGCWIDVAEGDNKIRFKVKDGDMIFPLSAKGHQATVEGIMEKIELDQEKAVRYLAHLAEEKGESFDSSSVTGPLTYWRINGKGALIARR
ncbi:MAG: DUF4920 domain-containing protein [Calditrichota bacterium]